MSKTSGLRHSVLVWLLMAAVFVGGCRDWDAAEGFFKTGWSRFLNPAKPLRRPEGSPVNTILPSIGLADQIEERLPNSTLPSEEDYLYDDKDYEIGPTDVVLIGIMDLFLEAVETQVQREVSNTGYIDLPLLESRVKAAGLTKEELKELIKEVYSPEIILQPLVSVRLISRRQSRFSLLGQGSQGTYLLTRRDTRLLDAFAIVGGMPDTTVPHIYIMRHKRAVGKSQAEAGMPEGAPIGPETRPAVTTRPATTKAVEPPTTLDAALRKFEAIMLKKKSTTQPTQPETLPAPSVMVHMSETSAPGGEGPSARREGSSFKWAWRDSKWVKVPLAAAAPEVQPAGRAAPAEDVDSVFVVRSRAVMGAVPVVAKPASRPVTGASVPDVPSVGAKAVPGEATTPRGGPRPVSSPPGGQVEDPFGWHKATRSDQVRIIAISLDKLKRGDPRMNVVIKNNDMIYVPAVKIGEFYVMGEVSRPGVYSLTGRRITIKQALAAAGNLGPDAWPSNSYLVRRVGQHQEQVIAIDVEKIFRGEEADIFLKPEDVIAVGTHIAVPFLHGLRGIVPTFSMAFSYSRSFAPQLLGYNQGSSEESRHSARFKRW